MPITVYPDRIDFTNYSLRLDSDGVRVTPVSSPSISGTFQAVSTSQLGSFQGTVSGYTSGGYVGLPTPTLAFNVIDKFSFSADGNATDVGDLTLSRRHVSGQSSSVSGYTSAGYAPTDPSGDVNTIDKFPFASNANATDVGDMTVARPYAAGHSSYFSGYVSGGTSAGSNVIDKFPFASNANATDVGDLTVSRLYLAGHSSGISGYASGGAGPTNVNTIDKFPFASNANATDVGDLVYIRNSHVGLSSSSFGYISGSQYSGIAIERFPFSTDANAVSLSAVLTSDRAGGAGQSSTLSGYTSGGTNTNIIDKFSFVNTSNATDVGDLTVARFRSAGQQY